ncbi:DUF3035 domain-containing protein [Rhodoligotrophos defluvii]|uniref:DUF3035 domain-containing protein n=1 Tax=Rhodoligotrophos defluvii TaxID=2561934 RepID=UPI001960A02E|nr:DUF3035 domain-containing protein [Rhodoligotrophos defluvii]
MLTAAGLLMSGCSGGAGVTDMLGMGKNVPDEREVRTHQVLAMPPDLTLKPPSPGAANEGTPNAAADAAAAAVGSQALHTPPETVLQQATPAPTAPPSSQAQAAATPAAPATPTVAPGSAPAQTASIPAQDVYQQYGISKTNPDGTPKSEADLARELKQKRIELERAKNPNYGSIWNIGNIFSD